MNPFKKCVKLIYVQNLNIFAGVMELADVTDSKSVGSDTVRVRPPPSAPEKDGDFQLKIAVSLYPFLTLTKSQKRRFTNDKTHSMLQA